MIKCVCVHVIVYSTGGLELSVSPSREPIEQDQVVLRCKADRLIYGNLAWFRVENEFDTEQVPAVQSCRGLSLSQQPLSQAVLSGLQGTNVTLELPLTNVSQRDQGVYACQVENIKTGERTCLLRHLTLRGTNLYLDHIYQSSPQSLGPLTGP